MNGEGPADPTHRRRLRDLLNRHGIRPSRRLGQNFLVDGNIRDRIVEALGPGPTDGVFELGPGAGALTVSLAEQCAWLVAVDYDRRLAAALKEVLPADAPATVIHRDALEIPWGETLAREALRNGVRIDRSLFVSNLPYSITGPALFRLLTEERSFPRAVVMVQKEVALRLTASAGTPAYGGLSVTAAYFCRVSPVMTVPPAAFWPRPKVASAVVALERRDTPPVAAEPGVLMAVVRAAFGQRRKTLSNALAAGLGINKADAESCARRAGIDPRRRGETLTLEEFGRLAEELPELPVRKGGAGHGRGP